MRRAHAEMQQEHLGSAILFFRKAYSMDKNDHQIMFRLGHALVMAGFSEEAVEILKRAVKKKPGHMDSLVLLSEAQLKCGDIDGMHATLDKALSWDPTHGLSVLTKVEAYLDSGFIEEARGVLDLIAALEEPSELIWMARARYARDTKAYGEAVDILHGVIDRGEASKTSSRTAVYELGYVLDKMGEYDRAFEYFKRANAGQLMGKTAHVESLQSTWSPEVLSSVPQSTIHDERPVIIAGMPRSGTTLTERVINAHALGGSVGECPLLLQQLSRTLAKNLDQDRVDSYAKEYLEMLDDRVGPSGQRVIDKHMGTEKNLGMISRVLPGARVIQALRDPRDCCLSAYFQNFGANVTYSRDLGMLGKQYRVHREMLDYWREQVDIPIYVSVYEEFVGDPEHHTRALLDFLGLEFDEACLKFYESKDHVNTRSSMQVRQPVYQSSKQRWKNYEKHLGPLLDALGPYADGVMAESSTGRADGSGSS